MTMSNPVHHEGEGEPLKVKASTADKAASRGGGGIHKPGRTRSSNTTHPMSPIR